MVKIHVGCAGWDYKDWRGIFYPKNLEKSSYLEYYSNYFDLLEVNSTFYNLPAEETVINWGQKVPKSFKFTIKVWQDITHDLFNSNLSSKISQFFYRLSPLKDKISSFLLQFPPWFKYSEKHLRQLSYIINQLPIQYKYVIELRDNSWYDVKILEELINGKKVILGTIYFEGIKEFYFPNQEIYYIRLIGNRQLNVFNRIQRDQKDILYRLFEKLEVLNKSPNVFEIFIIVNNHFTGFSPETANELKKMLNIPYKAFSKQKKLLDFF
ncbi:MAG: DUF72 domain-containing protein [Promethearchaeota archaeon]